MTSPPAPVETYKFKASHKLLVAVTLALGVALVFLVFFSHHGLYQIYRIRQERVQQEQENARLAAENDRLARTIERLHQDPELIQDLIRRELNFVKKNEIIFQLPPEVGSKLQLHAAEPEVPAVPRAKFEGAGAVGQGDPRGIPEVASPKKKRTPGG